MDPSPFIAVAPPLMYLAFAKNAPMRRLPAFTSAAFVVAVTVAYLQGRTWEPVAALAAGAVMFVVLVAVAGPTFSKRALVNGFTVTATSPLWATPATLIAIFVVGATVFVRSRRKASITKRLTVAAWVTFAGFPALTGPVMTAPITDEVLQKRVPLEPYIAAVLVLLATWNALV